jgi:hypothetical protein
MPRTVYIVGYLIYIKVAKVENPGRYCWQKWFSFCLTSFARKSAGKRAEDGSFAKEQHWQQRPPALINILTFANGIYRYSPFIH